MSEPLTVRDRPWSFWGGWVLVFFGATMLAVTLALPPRNARSRETTDFVRMVATAFLAFGAIGCWRGRAARYEPRSRRLLRGSEIVQDLTKARGLLVFKLEGRSQAHYVLLVLGERSLDANATELTVDDLRQEGNEVVPLAQGVPPGTAKRVAERWRDELEVRVVTLPGTAFEL